MNNQLRSLKIETKESHTVSIQTERKITEKVKGKKTESRQTKNERTLTDQMLSLAMVATHRHKIFLLHLSS